MAWTQPLYSRRAIREAGQVLIADLRSREDHELALTIANNWRSSHAFPLNTLQVNLRWVARKFEDAPTVAQRLKRLSSITSKLERLPWLNLDEMQDLGGCRAVMLNVGAVGSIVDYYERSSSMRHELVKKDDYISKPKRSGYRSVHLIYSYSSDKKQTFDGHKIEMQIRSQLQHAWATAVETAATFTAQSLKASMGDEDWLRFFALMSTELAFLEGMPRVPKTPADPTERRTEIRKLAKRLRVIERLTAYGTALRVIEENIVPLTKAHPWVLLELDPREKGGSVLTWRDFSNAAAASEAYNAIERATEGSPKDAVLVRVDSLGALRTAYPNYFADTAVFLEAVEAAIE